METPQVLLEHHLKAVATADLPARVRQGGGAMRRRRRGLSPVTCCGWSEQELLDRERRATERRIKEAKFPGGEESGHLRLPGGSRR